MQWIIRGNHLGNPLQDFKTVRQSAGWKQNTPNRCTVLFPRIWMRMKPPGSAPDPVPACNAKHRSSAHFSQKQDSRDASHDAHQPQEWDNSHRELTQLLISIDFHRFHFYGTASTHLDWFPKVRRAPSILSKLLSWNSVLYCPNLGTKPSTHPWNFNIWPEQFLYSPARLR